MRPIKRPFSKGASRVLYGRRKPRKTWFGSDSNFIGLRVFLPRNIHKMLMAFRSVKGIPIARLVAIAIYNEMRRDNPFYLNIKATTPFEPHKYQNEASVIYRFLQDNKGGMAKDLLLISKDLLGLHDEDTFLHGITELLETELVEEIEGYGGSDIPWIQVKIFKE